MLQNLPPKVSECLEKAAQAGHKAAQARDPEMQRFWSEMEQRWLGLAQSHDHVAKTEAFLSHVKRAAPPG